MKIFKISKGPNQNFLETPKEKNENFQNFWRLIEIY